MSTPFIDRLFARNLAVDLGTANTQIYIHDRGVVLDQPSVVCFRKSEQGSGRQRIAAVGQLAKALVGREPENIQAVRPLRHGVIANYNAAEQMMREFVGMAHARSLFGRRVEFTICVPSHATAVERRAIREAAGSAGASRVCLISEALASALGAGLPVCEATGSMVLNIGGGTTEVAVVSLGGVVYSESIRVGGDQFDEAIMSHVRALYGVQLGEQTAEHVKQTIGSASTCVPRESMRAVGRGVEDGLPRTVELSNHDIADALAAPLKLVIGAVKSALEYAPPELVTDIAHHGITLTGGGALLNNLGKRLYDEVGLIARAAEGPTTCAVRGAGEAMGRLATEPDA